MTWEEYIEWDKAWLEVCDALLFLDNSKGAKQELEYAKKLGKMIYYDVDTRNPELSNPLRPRAR